MARSTGIQPKGGYNFVLADYQGPQTAGAEVIGSDDPAGGTNWYSWHHTNHCLKVSLINEYGAGTGVTIDTSSGIGVLVQDGSVRTENTKWFMARNAANNANVNIARVNSSNVAELGSAFAFQNYLTPTITPVAGMTLSASSVFWYSYITLGGLTVVNFDIDVTFGGSAGNYVDVQIPVISIKNAITPCYMNPSSVTGGRTGLCTLAGGDTHLRIYRADQSNYSLATAYEIGVSLAYG